MNESSQENNCRTLSTKTSVLKSVHASKVTQPNSKKRDSRLRKEIPCSTPQPASKATTVSSIVSPVRIEAPKAKNDVSALHSVRSSTICKTKATGMPEKPRNGMRPPQIENALSPPPSSSARKSTKQRPVKKALRRSTRISKRPERFRPG